MMAVSYTHLPRYCRISFRSLEYDWPGISLKSSLARTEKSGEGLTSGVCLYPLILEISCWPRIYVCNIRHIIAHTFKISDLLQKSIIYTISARMGPVPWEATTKQICSAKFLQIRSNERTTVRKPFSVFNKIAWPSANNVSTAQLPIIKSP